MDKWYALSCNLYLQISYSGVLKKAAIDQHVKHAQIALRKAEESKQAFDLHIY